MKSTIKDQKVFVKLSGVTKLQKEYDRICELGRARREAGKPLDPLMAARARGIEFTIVSLELPIDIYH